jgi:hypothetical protein
MMKKTYIIPTIEVIEFAAENMIAASREDTGIGGGYVEGGVEGGLTNKRQPIGGTWNSDNWNQVEE